MATTSRLWSLIGLLRSQDSTAEAEVTPRSSCTGTGGKQVPVLNREESVISQIWSFARNRGRDDRVNSSVSQAWPGSICLRADRATSSTQLNTHEPSRVAELLSRFGRSVELPFLFVWTVLVTMIILVYAGFSKLVCDSCRKERNIGNDVILVTNAGRGLGRRLAVILGTKASVVVCWDPDTDRQMNTVYDIRHRGGRALGYTVDLSDENAVNSAARAVRRDVGCPAMLVMSSGRRPQHPLLLWTPRELEAIFRTNVLPHLVLLRTFLPDMITNNHGHVVSIISASASAPCAFDAPYAATKSGVSELMRGLREELEAHPNNRIKITCVYPNHMGKRPSLASTAQVVVSKVLRNRSSVVVPRTSIFWMNMLRMLPASARRRWMDFLDRASSRSFNSRSGRLRRGVTRGDSWTMLSGGAGPATSWTDFLKYAPFEVSINTRSELASYLSY